MSASSAASSLPASGKITRAQATEILSQYNPIPVDISPEESHRLNSQAEPSHHSWGSYTCIGRLKRGTCAPPSRSQTKHTVSMVGSNLALAFCKSKVPFHVNANHVYLVEKAEDEEPKAPFMLFTVGAGDAGPAGVYVATHEDNDEWASEWSGLGAKQQFTWRAKMWDWSVAQLVFHAAIGEKDGEDVSVSASTREAE